jgi:hypothetical protein
MTNSLYSQEKCCLSMKNVEKYNAKNVTNLTKIPRFRS